MFTVVEMLGIGHFYWFLRYLSDQNVLDDAIDGLHRGLKDKVSTLNEMEGEWCPRCLLSQLFHQIAFTVFFAWLIILYGWNHAYFIDR